MISAPLSSLADVNATALPDSTPADVEISYADLSAVDLRAQRVTPTPMRFGDAPSRARRRVRRGDVLLPYLTGGPSWKDVRPLRIGPDEAGIVFSTGFYSATPVEGVDPRYLAYAMGSRDCIAWLEKMSNGVTMHGFSEETFRHLPVPRHDAATQRVIADYLDSATSILDRIMGEKAALLELLVERRAGRINSAIGSRPDSEPRPELPWLRSVPKSWPSVRLGLVADVFSGTTPTEERTPDGEVAWTTSGELDQELITIPTGYISRAAQRRFGLRLAAAGTVVIGLVGQGRTRGASAQLAIDSTLNQNIAAIEPRDDRLEPNFLALLLRVAYEDLRNSGRGGNQAALNAEILRAYKIPLPRPSDQQHLVRTVRAEQQRDETLIGLLNQSISLLQERRQGLITAAISGDPTLDRLSA